MTRRALSVIAALFAFNTALAAHDGKWLLAMPLGAFVLVIASLRTHTTPERWPATERWLRSLWSGEGKR